LTDDLSIDDLATDDLATDDLVIDDLVIDHQSTDDFAAGAIGIRPFVRRRWSAYAPRV
jgi:hypothetical protein